MVVWTDGSAAFGAFVVAAGGSVLGFFLGFLLPPVCEADPLPVASFGAFFLLLLRLVSWYVWYEYVHIVLFPSPCTFSFFTGTCL